MNLTNILKLAFKNQVSLEDVIRDYEYFSKEKFVESKGYDQQGRQLRTTMDEAEEYAYKKIMIKYDLVCLYKKQSNCKDCDGMVIECKNYLSSKEAEKLEL